MASASIPVLSPVNLYPACAFLEAAIEHLTADGSPEIAAIRRSIIDNIRLCHHLMGVGDYDPAAHRGEDCGGDVTVRLDVTEARLRGNICDDGCGCEPWIAAHGVSDC